MLQTFFLHRPNLLSVEKWWLGRPLLPEILGQTDHIGAKSPIFRSIFAGSASAVTSNRKSSINTNRKSITRFPMSPRWTLYVVRKPPKGGSKCSVQSVNNKLRELRNSRKIDSDHRMSVFITNRKSHTGFRLVPTSMTLNGIIALVFFHRIR